jgi:hypothetical protein
MPRHRYVMRKGELVYLGDIDSSAPAFSGIQINNDNHYNYECPVTGDPITSRTQHKENLAKHNCRLLEKGEKENWQKERVKDRSIDQLIERMTPNG